MNPDEQSQQLPVFVKWMEFLQWLLPTADRMPKKTRFTFSSRIVNLAVDLLDDLIEARYSKNKETHLKSANLKLEKLRVFFRICFESKLISEKSYEYAAYSCNEIGKMLGGWLKYSRNA